MDAIYGYIDRKEAPTARSVLKTMTERLSHSTRPNCSQWCDDSAGMGSFNDSATSDSRSVQHRETPSIRVVADARIDNGKQLAGILELGTGNDASTERLLIAAYLRWGSDCASHLVGDFTFVILDDERNQIFCARDPFGVRPFYYHLSSKAFAFSTEIEALVAIPNISNRINEWRIAELLIDSFIDKDTTYFEAINRLPAAHSLTITRKSAEIVRYWSPESVSNLHLKSDRDYEETFRGLLGEAIDARTDDHQTAGFQLSGGLDSSSVLCLARFKTDGRPVLNQSLQTFSAVYPELPECDERPFINVVNEHCGTQPNFVYPSNHSPLAERFGRQNRFSEPLYWPTWAMESAIYESARQRGVKSLLGGHGGDHVLAEYPTGYYADLLRSGHWHTLVDELAMLGSASGRNFSALLWSDALKPVMLGAAPTSLLQLYRRKRGSYDRIDTELNLGFGKRLGVRERVISSLTADEKKQKTSRGAHEYLLDDTATQYGFERLNLVAPRYGLKLQHPFWHLPLIEFCLGLPRSQLYNGAQTRDLMRRALSDDLPEYVRNRKSKAFFNSLLCIGLWNHEKEGLQALIADPGSIEEWVNVKALRAAYARYAQSPGDSFREARFLLAALSLSTWQTSRR